MWCYSRRVFLILQLLPIGFAQQNLCCDSKPALNQHKDGIVNQISPGLVHQVGAFKTCPYRFVADLSQLDFFTLTNTLLICPNSKFSPSHFVGVVNNYLILTIRVAQLRSICSMVLLGLFLKFACCVSNWTCFSS